jgi:hypothetical protein
MRRALATADGQAVGLLYVICGNNTVKLSAAVQKLGSVTMTDITYVLVHGSWMGKFC